MLSALCRGPGKSSRKLRDAFNLPYRRCADVVIADGNTVPSCVRQSSLLAQITHGDRREQAVMNAREEVIALRSLPDS
jgi:hypothetical protein